MSRPYGFIRTIYRAAGEIHAQLVGSDYKRKHCEMALAKRFSGGRYGCEQNVALPCVIPEAEWNSVFPRPQSIRADFTFFNRHVLVRIVFYKQSISEGACRDMWRRMYAADIPLGLILNFGRPVFEYRRVMYRRRLAQWREERCLGVGAPGASSMKKGRLAAFLYASEQQPLAEGVNTRLYGQVISKCDS
ncbi:hypothetical protein AGMMS49942_05770 [Spirochaetia bacterium]|nr:hypothetical protein AGMMS49942_05770 [Spirochaetia bacterium]